jgi:hypothetical protein
MELDQVASIWWSPDNSEDQHDGHISVRADGSAEIQLFGAFGDALLSSPESAPSLLYGVGVDGERFTARRSLLSGSRSGLFSGFTTSKYRPLSLIIGKAHVDEATAYNMARLEVTYLRDWLANSGLRPELQTPIGDEPGTLGVRYQSPDAQSAQLSSGAQVSTWTSHHLESTTRGYLQTEDVALEVELPEPLPIDELIAAYVTPFLDLLTFATGQRNRIDRLTVHSPALTRVTGGKTFPIQLQFITKWTGSPPEDAGRLVPNDMKFTASEAPGGLQAIIPRWFDLHRELRMALAPYLGLSYAPTQYIDLQLVSISLALEAYHRAGHGTAAKSRALMKKGEFRDFKAKVLEACPARLVDTMDQKLAFFNEKPQTDRLTELVARVKEPLPWVAPSFPDFATDFIAARNLKTHPDPSKRQFSAQEMFDLTRVATYVFDANLMLDLGFTAENCHDLLSRNRSIAQFVVNSRRHQAD